MCTPQVVTRETSRHPDEGTFYKPQRDRERKMAERDHSPQFYEHRAKYPKTPGFTEDYDFFNGKLRCPYCNARYSHIDLYKDGQVITGRRFWTLYAFQVVRTPKGEDKGRLQLRCRSCSASWSVYEGADSLSVWRCTAIEETFRSEEVVGRDERTIINSTSTASNRILKVSREWTNTVILETSHTSAPSLKASLPCLELAANKSFQQKYSLTLGEKRTVEETIDVSVAPHTEVRLSLAWKRIWQHGHLVFESNESLTERVPFRVAASLTFDQWQREIEVREDEPDQL